MKYLSIAFFCFFTAVCLSGTSDQRREPALFPAFYVVRVPKLESLRDVWIRHVTITISKSGGYYLNAVPGDWLVSMSIRGAYRVDFYPWPVAPGETTKKQLQLESLDQVVLVDPIEGADGMPTMPHVSITVEFFKKEAGLSSMEIGDAKIEIRRWPPDGVFKR